MAISFVSWNLNGVTFAGPAQRGGNSAAEGFDYLARTLRAVSADIVALQELPSGDRDQAALDAALAQLREYQFKTIHPVSPSPVQTADRIGLAVLSKHEIVDVQLAKLPAPQLKFVGVDGKKQPLHDKAVLTATVRAPGGDILLLCTHLYPFKAQRRRPGEREFEELSRSFRDIVQRAASSALVICADLNIDKLDDILPGIEATYSLRGHIVAPTHWVRGELVPSDHIISTSHFDLDYSRTIPTRFDHHLCFAVLSRKSDPGHARRSGKLQTGNDAFSILHLSDLHYGEGTQGDVDWKVWLDGAERAQRVNRLPTYIRNLPACPDFLVVSGDITIAGNAAGFVEFETTLLSGIREHRLPDARHIVIVPGNHDVSRSEEARSDKRWESFQAHFGSRFVVPWLPVHPAPEQVLAQLKARPLESMQMIGGAEQVTDSRTGLTETAFLPFTFDRRKKVLLYAFNSSLIAGTRISSGKKLERYFENLRELGQRPPNYDELVQELVGLRSVDPSRIEPTELTLFHGIVETLRRRLPDEYQQSLKIAVLHHHVVPFIPEEVKQFELLLNAGQFKKQLVDAGFQIVIHGHKHWADMVVDSALPEGKELLIISGGTIGGGPSKGKAGFNWLLLEQNANVTYVRRHFVPVTSDSAEDAISAGLDAPEQTKALRRGRPVLGTLPTVKSFLGICQAVEDSLVRYLVRVKPKTPGDRPFAGWNNYLGEESISVLGTAFCCQIIDAIKSKRQQFKAAQPGIIDYLKSMRRDNGYWSSTANGEPGQPIETCLVLGALLSLSWDEAIPVGRKLLEDFLQGRWPSVVDSTYAVSLFLTFAVTHYADSSAIEQLSAILSDGACKGVNGAVVGWSASTEMQVSTDGSPTDDLAPQSLAPSVAHTAYALAALTAAARAVGEDGSLQKLDTGECIAFLRQQPWDPTSEDITEDGGKSLLCSHNTPAIAMLALLGAGVSPSDERLVRGIRAIVDSQDAGLWDFGSIRRPSWNTLSNVLALKAYSEASELGRNDS